MFVYNVSMSTILKKIESVIDATTMYRVVSIALHGLVVVALMYGVVGLIPQTISQQIISLAVALFVCLILNAIIGRIFHLPVNHESAVITALILFFLINPARDLFNHHVIALAAAIATVSKYLIAWRGQHIANPAAVGIMVLSLIGYYESTWWIATPPLFIPLLVAGLAIVYKIRKWAMVGAFVGVGFIVFLFEEWKFMGSLDGWSTFWLSYPALFLAFFMLTEPFTTPPTKRLQIAYGTLVGFLSHTTVFAPWLKMSPELALVIGNVAFFPTSVRRKLRLAFKEKIMVARDTYEWVFEKPIGMTYQAGQYLEWMLPHQKTDKRGIRRYFTIASSPCEDVIRVAARYPNIHSSYKTALMALTPGDTITASQRAGDFILPAALDAKIAMIAGGIGVTPFVSHIRTMTLSNKWHDTTLFYCNNHKADEAYDELWKDAETHNSFKLISIFAKESPSSEYETGYLSVEHITKHAPDYKERIWYISGPPVMVTASEKILRKLKVPRQQIVKDFFPGLA